MMQPGVDPLTKPVADGWRRIKTGYVQDGPHGPNWCWRWPTAILVAGDTDKGTCIIDVPVEDTLEGCTHDWGKGKRCPDLHTHLEGRYTPGKPRKWTPDVIREG